MDQQPYQQPYQQYPQQTPPAGQGPQTGYGYTPPPQGQPGQGQIYGGQPAYLQQQQYVPTTIDPRKGQAVSGFILGLVGLIAIFFAWMPGLIYIDLIMTILGIILSTMGMKSTTSRGLAIAGLVLSIIGLVIVGIILLIALSFLSALSRL